MPLKRVTARKRRKQEDEPGTITDDSLVQAPKKRGRVGKLAGLTEMPIDILYEVCCTYMRIIRPTKSSTDLLLHVSRRFVEAFANDKSFQACVDEPILGLRLADCPREYRSA
jgi:hypothetical protein